VQTGIAGQANFRHLPLEKRREGEEKREPAVKRSETTV
jgi:hypothetical protein